MNFKKLFLLCLLFIAPHIFADGVGSRFSIFSDYVFRGASRTDHGPHVRGDMAYEWKGLSIGGSAGNVGADDARGMEVIARIDYKYSILPWFAIDPKIEFYHAPYAATADTKFFDLGFLFTEYAKIGLSYAPSYFGASTSSTYIYACTHYPIWAAESLILKLNGGYSRFKEEAKAGNRSYVDYRISLHKKEKSHDIGIFWVGTTRRLYDGAKLDKFAKDEGFGASYTYHISSNR